MDKTSLTQLVSGIASSPGTEQLTQLKKELSVITDAQVLRDIAYDFSADTEVSILLMKRVLEIIQDDIEALVHIAWSYWLINEESAAMPYFQKAKLTEPNNPKVIELENTLRG